MTSRPVYTSKAEGFRTAEEIDAMRPVVAPRPRTSRKVQAVKAAVESQRHCIRCGYRTNDVEDFAQHVAAELWQARIEIAGSDAEDIDIHVAGKRRPKLGALPLALSEFLAWRDSLTHEELLLAQAERQRLRRSGEPVPEEVHQKAMEYGRRLQNRRKELSPEERATSWERARADRLDRIREDVAYRLEVLPVSLRRARRIELGKTPAQVCSALDITRSTLVNWESGKTTPEGALFMDYAALLKVDVPRPVKEWKRVRGVAHKHGTVAKYKRGCCCVRCRAAVAADARDRGLSRARG